MTDARMTQPDPTEEQIAQIVEELLTAGERLMDDLRLMGLPAPFYPYTQQFAGAMRRADESRHQQAVAASVPGAAQEGRVDLAAIKAQLQVRWRANGGEMRSGLSTDDVTALVAEVERLRGLSDLYRTGSEALGRTVEAQHEIRKALTAQLQAANDSVAKARELLSELAERDSECLFDHHGNCQQHMGGGEGRCSNAAAIAWLDSTDADAAKAHGREAR